MGLKIYLKQFAFYIPLNLIFQKIVLCVPTNTFGISVLWGQGEPRMGPVRLSIYWTRGELVYGCVWREGLKTWALLTPGISTVASTSTS